MKNSYARSGRISYSIPAPGFYSEAMNAMMRYVLVPVVASFAISAACLAAPEEIAPPVAAGAQVLNLPQLEERVLASEAVPVARKLEWQNEADALMERFRALHDPDAGELSSLRRVFDRLLAKVQALVGTDRQLETEIAASREAMWTELRERADSARL